MTNHVELALVLSSVLLACGGQIEGKSTSWSNGDGSGSNSGAGASGDSSRSSNESNTSPGSGTSSNSYNEPCFGHPRCDLGDVEEDTEADACTGVQGTLCYKRVACEGTLWCRHFDDDECKGWRTCDAGQTEVKTCPAGAECIVKTTCGRSILCQKLDPDCAAPLPECEILESRHSDSSGCRANWSKGSGEWPPRTAKDCLTRANACGFTVWCQAH